MAETYVPGLQFQDWTKASSLTNDALGTMVAAMIGGPLVAAAKSIKGAISPSEESQSQPATSQAPAPVAPPPQYEPNSNFPELFRQQYVSPYAQPYTPPGSAPPPMQGFMTPGMMNPNQALSSPFARQPLQQAQPSINDQVSQIWGQNPLGGK
jgi:hypothetical protein